MQENCVENLLPVAFSSMWILFSGVGQSSQNMQVVYMEMTRDGVNSNGIWLVEYNQE